MVAVLWGQAPLRYFEMLNEHERVALAADEHLFVELACIWCCTSPLRTHLLFPCLALG